MEKTILPSSNQYKKYSQTIAPFLESQQTKNYTTVIFFFLVLSVFSWYAIRPTIQTILYLRREIKDKTQIDKQMDAKIYALIEANANFENNQALFPVLSEAVPKTPEAVDLVSQLTNLALEKNLLLSQLKTADIPLSTSSAVIPSTNQKQFTELPMEFTIEGPYSSVTSYFRDLINLRRVVTIQSMNFLPLQTPVISASGSGIPATLKVSVDLVTYYETK